MPKLRPIHMSGPFNASGIWNRVAFFMAIAIPVLFIGTGAFAEPGGGTGSGNLSGLVTSNLNKTNSIVNVFAYISYVMGAALFFLGLGDVRRHAENASQMPLRTPLIKMAAAGILLTLPLITGLFSETMAGSKLTAFEIIKMNSFTFNSQGTNTAGLSGLIANGINNTGIFVNAASFAAYVIGVFFIIRGIQMLRAHIENPGNAPLPDALKRLAVAGLMLALPLIVNVIYNTFGAKGDALGNTGWSSTGGTAGSLDGMMVSFISDISNAGFFGIEMFCYIAGILMVFFALQRLVRTAQDGPRGPLGFGTIVTFVTAGLLLSFPQFLTVLNTSLLGGNQALTKVTFMSNSGVDAAQIANAQSVFSAVLAFMAVIGFLSVVRGLFLFKSFADGNNQATMMSVVTHLVAGSIAINLGQFINAVQTSLGVTTFPVTFN